MEKPKILSQDRIDELLKIESLNSASAEHCNIVANIVAQAALDDCWKKTLEQIMGWLKKHNDFNGCTAGTGVGYGLLLTIKDWQALQSELEAIKGEIDEKTRTKS